MSNYKGVPAPLYDKFINEPLIPEFALNIYNVVLGPALIILGLSLFLGIATRFSLFLMGLIYTSLTFGLILIKQDAGIAWLGVHIIMIVMGLALAKYNKFAILEQVVNSAITHGLRTSQSLSPRIPFKVNYWGRPCARCTLHSRS